MSVMGYRTSGMVGREAPLRELLEAASAARDGEARSILVTGEAGIGKSRLVAELLEHCEQWALVASGHGTPLSSGALPYGVASEMLRSLTRRVGKERLWACLGDRIELLAPLVPSLVPSSGPKANVGVDQFALLASTGDLLTELSQDQPLILVAEDLHWADDATLDLLTYWTRTIIDAPLLLVGTTRDAGVESNLFDKVSGLGRGPRARQLGLTPLTADEIVLQALGLDDDVDADVIRAAQRLSDGNPLFVEEIVSGGVTSLPRRLQVNLAGRLTQVDARTAEILFVQSLNARPVDVETLALVVEASVTEVEEALDQADRSGIVSNEPDGLWRFHHELLRQAVAKSAKPSQRRRGHRQWADALSARTGIADMVAVADHLNELGPSREAFVARRRAAEAVSAVARGTEAKLQWREALSMIHQDPSIATEEERTYVLATALMNLAAWDAIFPLVEADERVPPAAVGVRHTILTAARWGASRVLPGIDPPADIDAPAAAQMVSRIHAMGPSAETYAAAFYLVQGFHWNGLIEERNRAIQVLADIAHQVPAVTTSGVNWAVAWQIMAEHGPDRMRRRLDLARDALEASRDRDWATRSWAHAEVAAWSTSCGLLRDALAHARQSLRLVPATSVEAYGQQGLAIAALACYLLGQWDDAIDVVHQQMSILAATDIRRPWAAQTEAMIAAYRGDSLRAQDTIQVVRDALSGDHFGPATETELHFQIDLLAAVDKETTAPEVAGRLLRPYLLGADELVLGDFGFCDEAVVLASRLAWRTSDPDLAAVTRGAMQEVFGPDGEVNQAGRAEVEANLARAVGTENRQTWIDVVGRWQELEVPFSAAQCQLRLGETLLAQGHRDDVEDVLKAATITADELGARPLADEIRTLAARARIVLGGDPDPMRTSGIALTTRELEVLQLVCQGMTNDQIGTTLFISPKTASVHVSRILAKLHATNRTQLATIAQQRGLITTGSQTDAPPADRDRSIRIERR